MTSVGVKIDNSVTRQSGPYCFKIQGELYHLTGALLPHNDLFFFFFVQKFITRCSVTVRGRLSTTSSLHRPQGPDCPITRKRHYQ